MNATAVTVLKETENHLACTFAMVSSGETSSVKFARHLDRVESQHLDFSNFRDVRNLEVNSDVNFGIEKLEVSFRQRGTTSHGPDNISYDMLWRLGAEDCRFLLHVYNGI